MNPSLRSRSMILVVTMVAIAPWVSLYPHGQALAQPSVSSAPLPNSATPTVSPLDPIYPTYRLGAGDAVNVVVFGFDEYTGTQVILPDGTISLPLVGTVDAVGKTATQLAEDITFRLQPFLVNPVVTVGLLSQRPVVVTVAGEVMRPGPVQLQSLAPATVSSSEPIVPPTLSTALAAAGGITQYADIRTVELRRSGPRGQSDGMTINLWDAIATQNAPPDLILQDGDSIYVPRLRAGDETLNRRLVAQSSYAPATVRVRVVGEVTQPGEVQVPPNSSISSAVAIAGGPTSDARLSRVAFVRMDETGQIERETLDLSNLNDTYQIQEGDVIIVPKRSSSSFLDFAGRIISPLGILRNLFP